MHDEELWKRRFAQLSLLRLGGLIVFMLGVAIIFTDLVRDGGAPRLGAILAILGALDTMLAPKILKKIWERQ